jgi:hypothetical protein
MFYGIRFLLLIEIVIHVKIVILFFKFMILCHWLASHEGFNIKSRHILTKCFKISEIIF